jgi:hypothetical protein
MIVFIPKSEITEVKIKCIYAMLIAAKESGVAVIDVPGSLIIIPDTHTSGAISLLGKYAAMKDDKDEESK